MPLVTLTTCAGQGAGRIDAVLDACLDTEQVMLVFQEKAWENWAFAGGRQIHA